MGQGYFCSSNNCHTCLAQLILKDKNMNTSVCHQDILTAVGAIQCVNSSGNLHSIWLVL